MAKILIIDDDETTRAVLKRMLEADDQYETAMAADGKAGLAAAAAHEPDLILLDIMMPGMNGLHVLQKLGENKKTKYIPVIILTGVDDAETKREALQSLANKYLVKPVERSVLVASIEATLNP